MKKIILSEYNAIPENYRGIWTVDVGTCQIGRKYEKNISASAP